MARKIKYHPTDPRDLPGDNFAFVKKVLTVKAPAVIELVPASQPEPVSVEVRLDALSEMLRLNPEQAKHLEGASRLNFWHNGSLNVQVQHGSRGIKLACPKAVVTDADLIEFFAAWGWKRINGNLYFQWTPASLVQL